MKNITHILHFPAFEFYIPDRIMQTVQQERGMDMKQIFVSSTLLWNAGLEEMFQRVYDNGFDGIELWAQQFFARGYDTQEYLRLQALYPLRTCVHSCSWDLNLASMNQGIREMSIKQVEASMRLAAELEAMELTVHPGHMTLPGRREESMKLLQDSLEQIGRLSDRIGVDVSLEIMEKIPKEFVTDAQSMEEAAGSRKKQFFYTLDIAHCDSEEEPFHILDQMKRISKIHISNRKGKCYHTPLGNGDFSFKEMLPQLLA